MLRNERQGVLHGGLPAVHGLAGQTVDEVQGQVGKASLPGGGGRFVDLLGGVDAVDALQLAGVGRLHSHGQAVDPCLAQDFQRLHVHTVGITLHGDLGILLYLIKLADHTQQLFEPLGPVVARGAASDVDGIYRKVLGQGGGLLNVGEQRLLILVHPVVPTGQGVKVAVVALTAAEGNMDIDAQLVRHGYTPHKVMKNIVWNKPGFAPTHYIPQSLGVQGREKRENAVFLRRKLAKYAETQKRCKACLTCNVKQAILFL